MSDGGKELILAQSPIQRPKLYQLAAKQLEDMIRSGELKPGDPLPSERNIMEAFSIGRPAVREAFLSLQSKGFITTQSGRRARVSVPSVDHVFLALDGVVGMIIKNGESLKNLYDARKFIEVAMARHAAMAITPTRLAELKRALDSNRRAIGDRDLFMRTDIEFHRILFLVSGNPVFEAVHSALVNWLRERWGQIHRDESTEKLAFKGHSQVYDAVARHDADAAETAMHKHLSSSWAVWVRRSDET